MSSRDGSLELSYLSDLANLLDKTSRVQVHFPVPRHRLGCRSAVRVCLAGHTVLDRLPF